MEERMTFAQFVQSWPGEFVRGVSDCCAFVARWGAEVSGVLAGAEILESAPYTDEEARGILHDAGGLRPLIRQSFLEVGWQEVEEPSDGDVVVCPVPDAAGQTVGIWKRGRVVSVGEDGSIVALLAEPNLILRWE